jgi:hypothetical protein
MLTVFSNFLRCALSFVDFLGKKRMLYTGGSKLKIQKVSTPRGSHLMTAWIS